MLSRQILVRTATWLQSRLLLINTRRSKFVILSGFAILCVLYFGSSYLLPVHKRFSSHRHFETCLDRHLLNLDIQIAAGDIVVKHGSQKFLDINFLALTGNGYFGITLEDHKFSCSLLSNDSAKTYSFPFPQQLGVDFEGIRFDGHEAIVLNLKAGSIHRLDSLQSRGGCVVVDHVLFAHRSYRNVVLQKIVVSNYGKSSVKAKVVQTTPSKKFKVTMKTSTSTDEEAKEYAIVSGKKHHQKGAVKFVAISSRMEKTFEVGAFTSSSVTQMMLLDARYIADRSMEPQSSNRNTNSPQLNPHEVQAEQAYVKLVNQNKILLKEQSNAMSKIWSQHINVESKNDPNTPSAIHVFLMEYYLACLLPYNVSHVKAKEINGKTGDCYSGAETMHAAELWVVPTSTVKLMALKEKWLKQLTGAGCGQLVAAGFYGFQEAISLSFSGLKFTTESLQLAINPLSLSSNVSLKHVYSYNHFINIRIEINPVDFHQVVRVQVDDLLQPNLCACGAGCKEIVKLKNAYMTFPVFVTAPVTPILYISANRSDLEVIQKRSFIIQASQGLSSQHNEKGASDHFKLSPKFWVAVSVLIIGFHLVVVKMIYNECRKDKGRRSGRAFMS